MVKTASELRTEFLLNPEIAFLNHGSFGACPKPVFDVYQQWQRQLEYQPVEFFGRQYNGMMDTARAALAEYVQVDADDLIFVPNATVAVNMVARSLTLSAGDDVLGTDHEYGAMDMTWRFICGRAGATYRTATLPFPLSSVEETVEAFWAQVSAKTKVIFLSHITSPTALILPVQQICRRAREQGIITVVDGAHAPGQIPLNCTSIGADYYTGNCHKWLCAAKGAGFLYVKKEQQKTLIPSVISWGWEQETVFAARHQWQGTRDIAAYLSIPAAIHYQQERDWPEIRNRCFTLLKETAQRINALTGLPLVAPLTEEWHAQMAVIALPLKTQEMATFKTALIDTYGVEIPLIDWKGRVYMRLSIQGYNTQDDVDRLVAAVRG